ncbi:fungal-specific transcription factor domain-containing protein [Aspergillus cavernicola]|uniref:Fungal-specific transcription factor domain-containing protein n=1 Tax=Aspergillus cavernicola TaxID=176166 RepID=A0ABR4HAK1_9EURO
MTDNLPRKRRRPAKSCGPCRQRKVRCDLNQPCGQCTRAKSSLNCLYRDHEVAANAAVVRSKSDSQFRVQRISHMSHSQPQGIPRNVLTPSSIGAEAGGSNEDLQQTIRDIQGRLDSLEGRLANSGANDVLSTQHPDIQRDLRALTARVQTVGAQLTTGSNAAGTPRKDHTSVGTMPLRLHHSASKVKFLGPAHWCNKMDKLSVAQMLNKKDPEPSLRELKNDVIKNVKECRDLRRSIKSQRSVKLNEPLPDLRGTIPSREECNKLVHCYLRTFEPVYRVLHIHSFWTEYEEFWKHPQSTSTPFLVKLVLILAIGTVFCSAEGSPMRDEYHQRAQTWIYAVQWWLVGPSEKSTVNLDGLQVSCLLLISRKACGLGSSPWLSAGSLMRMAVSMGLHRDPTNFPSLSLFQSEMRRRLWGTVLELALQDSLDSATPLLVPASIDTTAPSNVDDQDLSQDTTSIPLSELSNKLTDTSVQVLLHESVGLRIQVLEVIHERHEQSYQRVLVLGDKLRAVCRKIAAFFRSAKAPREGGSSFELTEFHAKFIDVQLQRYTLALYTPFMVQARNNPQFYYARKACLDSAVAIASYANPLCLPSEIPDDLSRLFIQGKGSFKGPLSLDVISALGLEIITQLEEERPQCLPGLDGDPVDQLADANRDHLIHLLEHILNQLFHIISMGTPSMKRFGLLAAVLGQIQATKAGHCVKRAIYEATTQSFKDCYSALRSSATHTTGATEGLTDGIDMSGDFDLPDPTLSGFDMDLGDPMFDLELQALFPFAGLDDSISSHFS